MEEATTVIVAGASGGLGAATARIASDLGAHLILGGRSEGALGDLANDIQKKGGKALPVAGDIRQPETCIRLCKHALDNFGRIDGIVNCAGIIEPISSISDCDPQLWKDNWEVNVLAAVLLTKTALPHLRESSGRNLIVSSGLSDSPMPGLGAYGVAKAALNHFTKVMAEEEKTLTSIAIDPGIVDTAMQERIRTGGAVGMPTNKHALFVGFHEKGQLLPPERPARSLAILALYAPHGMSGGFVKWNDQKVQKIVRRHGQGTRRPGYPLDWRTRYM